MKNRSTKRSREAGFSMMEVLAAMTLLSIVGLAISNSMIVAIRFQKIAEVGNMAKNLAVSKAEELSGVQLTALSDTYDATENNLVVGSGKIKFTRVTNITVNSDGSRTVDVTVSSTSKYLPKAVKYTTRFAPWES